MSIEHALVTNSSSSVTQLEKENIELKTRLDELSSKYNVLQANYVHLKCSHEKLVESHIMLEVAHEVVITLVKSSQPLIHTLTYTPSQFNIPCTNVCCSQASQPSIEQAIARDCDGEITKENEELKEEVERLRKDGESIEGQREVLGL